MDSARGAQRMSSPARAGGRSPHERVRCNEGLDVTVRLQQLAKLLNSEAGITDDTAEGESVDGIVARDSQNARAVRHNDVLALADDRETCLLEGTCCIEMVDARDLGQG